MHIVIAYTLVPIMLFLSAIHIYWGHGGLWPGKTKQELVDKVFGQGSEFPSIGACYFVAFGILLAAVGALLVAHPAATDLNSGYVHGFNGFISLVFLGRGLLAYLPAVEKNWNPTFISLNRRIYSPLCIAVGTGFLVLAIP
jgi:hypothetical protein